MEPASALGNALEFLAPLLKLLVGPAPLLGGIRGQLATVDREVFLADEAQLRRVEQYVTEQAHNLMLQLADEDGAGHSLRRIADARRDRVLERLGYRVLRIDAELVRCNLAEAVARILTALQELA